MTNGQLYFYMLFKSGENTAPTQCHMSRTCKVRISKVKVTRKNSSYMSWKLKENKATKIHIWITCLHVLRNHFKVTNLKVMVISIEGRQGPRLWKPYQTACSQSGTESQQPGYKVGPGQCPSGVVVVLAVKLIGSGRRHSALSRQFAVAADAWDVDLNLLVITESEPASASTWAIRQHKLLSSCGCGMNISATTAGVCATTVTANLMLAIFSIVIARSLISF